MQNRNTTSRLMAVIAQSETETEAVYPQQSRDEIYANESTVVTDMMLEMAERTMNTKPPQSDSESAYDAALEAKPSTKKRKKHSFNLNDAQKQKRHDKDEPDSSKGYAPYP